MDTPVPTQDVFLQPGEFWFGGERTAVRTMLGSCVAITLWHPGRRIGGMCHYMLPDEPEGSSGGLDGRYATHAVEMFVREVRRAATQPNQYQVKVFGGGAMFPPDRVRGIDVGRRNIEAGKVLLARHGFHIHSEHLAGLGYRNVVFEVWSGDVWIRHQETVLGSVNTEGLQGAARGGRRGQQGRA